MISSLPLALALAFQGSPVDYPMIFEVPGSIPSGEFGRCVPVELTGQRQMHVATLIDDMPLIIVEPGVFRQFYPAIEAKPTNDLDALPASGRAVLQFQDDLILARPEGLTLYSWARGGPILVPLDHTATYRDCELVRVRDVNMDGLVDIITVLDGGQKIAIKLQNAAGGFDDTGGAIVTRGAVRDLDTINFSSSPWGRQVVVNDSEGFEVFNQSVPGGAWLSHVWHPSLREGLDCMTVVAGGLSLPDADQLYFATAKKVNSGASPRNGSAVNNRQALYLLDRNGLHFQETTDKQVLGMTSGRCNLDSLNDVALTTASNDSLVFVYAGPNPVSRFHLSNSHSIGVAETSGSPPLIVELNNDGYGVEAAQTPDCVLAYGDVLVVDGPLAPNTADVGGSFNVDFIDHLTCKVVHNTLHTINPQCWFGKVGEYAALGWEVEIAQLHQVKDAIFGSSATDSFGYYDLKDPVFLGLPGQEFQVNFGILNDLYGHSSNYEENSHYHTLRLVQRINGDVVLSGPKLIGCFCKDDETRAELEEWLWPDSNFLTVGHCSSGSDRVLGHARLRRGPPLDSMLVPSEPTARINEPDWGPGY